MDHSDPRNADQSAPRGRCVCSEEAPCSWIGIDVSKLTLDVCIVRLNGKPLHKQFTNNAPGFAKLLRWYGQLALGAGHFCLESTGAHSTPLATFLVEMQQVVSVVNPARVKYFAMGLGLINKTDKVDAFAIAEYARLKRPAPWRMSAPEVRHLVALVRRYDDLQGLLTQEENRLREPGLVKEVERMLRQSVRFLTKQLEQVRSQVEKHIDNHPRLKADRALLVTIPGIGPMAAAWLLAELPDVDQFPDSQSAAAFAGLSPSERQSGTSIRGRTRLSKAGNRYLRKALFLPAISARRFNPIVKQLYERLIARGKPKMVAIGACMRKLLMIAYGVLKSRTDFHVSAEPAVE